VIRVLVVDDHAVVRQGLRTFLDLQDDLDVVGEAGDGAEAVAEAERLAPDVVLMDLAMPGVDGVSAIRELRARVPDTRAIALTSFSDDARVFGAIRAGAAGYLLKDVDPAELVAGIRAVAAGQGLLSPPVAARLLEEMSSERPTADEATAALTPREREVLILIAGGRSNKRIALELGVAEKTVKTHVGHVLGKLGVSDRTQAALWAVRHGLVD
jgi:two-component system, NarL family, response regulator LiaR